MSLIASGSRTAKTVPLDVVGSTKFDRYKKQAIEETFNMIISDGAFVPFAGYRQKIKLQPSGSARGLYKSTKFNHMCTVIDDSFYIISDNLAFNKEFTLDTQLGDVFFAENNSNQIAVVDGLFVYIFDYSSGGSFTKVTIPDGFLPAYITSQDNYFIAIDSRTNAWRLSELGNGTSWPSGEQNVAALETKPDTGVAIVQFNRQLFVMGNNTAEIWHDVGNTRFPYQRDNSLSIDYGCISAATVASGFGLLVWLAANEKAGPTIVVSRGGEVEAISTDGIDFRLDKIEKPEDSSGFLFEEDGHIFYMITFKSDKASFVYDFDTKMFFTVTSHCLEEPHIAKSVVFFNNTHYFVSNIDAALYEMSTDITTVAVDDQAHAYPRVRMTRNFRLPTAERFIIENLGVTIEQGNSFDLQKVDMSISKDGSASFGHVQSKTLNKIGNRPNKLQWWRLGAANDAVFQFRFWSDDRFVIINGTVRYRL
jgi:hypothetical protein